MKLINPEIRLETTNLCNARCVTCPRETLTRPMGTMSMDLFESLVDQALELGADEISPFGYGEPLMDKGIANKVAYCTSKGLKTFITTNASLLDTSKAFDLIDAGLSHIRFSVHGIGKEYEAVHQNLTWETTSFNIRMFLKINKKKSNAVRTEVTYMPMMLRTESEISQIVQCWKCSGINDIEVWKPHNWTTGKQYRNVCTHKKTCGRPEKGPLQIQWDGTVIVCCFDYNGVLVVGDANKDSLETILKSPEYNRIREKHEKGDMSGLICESCDQLNDGDSPLLFTTKDGGNLENGRTSSTKFRLL